MIKYKCPACDTLSITLVKKYFAAPLIGVECPSCGVKLKPKKLIHNLISIPQHLFIILYAFIVFIKPSFFNVTILITGWVIFDVIRLKYVDLTIVDKEGKEGSKQEV